MVELRPSRCLYCKKQFKPNFRLSGRQKTCGIEACRKFNRRRYQKRWRKINSSIESEYQAKRSKNRSQDFWKNYRKGHLESTLRNRILTSIRKKLKHVGLQRDIDRRF
jgi:hypothetical protein